MSELRTTKEIGDFGEAQAAAFLQKNGFSVLERQYRYGKCEIDIIADNGEVTAFIEVKTRSLSGPQSGNFGRPARAVTKEKQSHLLKATYDYLRKHPSHHQPRMDVIEVYLDKTPDGLTVKNIIYMKNAFGRTHK